MVFRAIMTVLIGALLYGAGPGRVPPEADTGVVHVALHGPGADDGRLVR